MGHSSLGMQRRGQPKKGPAPILIGVRAHRPHQPGAAESGPPWWFNVSSDAEFHARQRQQTFAGPFADLAVNPAYAPMEMGEHRHFDRPAHQTRYSHLPEDRPAPPAQPCCRCYFWKRRTATTGTCWHKADLYPRAEAGTHEVSTCGQWRQRVAR